VFHIVLYRPEIPPNTGNIIRLCANTGSRLHLIRPLGFTLDDKRLRRAGLDYHEFADVRLHDDLSGCLAALAAGRVFALSTRADTALYAQKFLPGDIFLFGPETRGLPTNVMASLPPNHCLRLPMLAAQRSLNIANAAAVVVFEAWRQNGFKGAV
jgi:tRNA (cytidine/uridine-2'-O-)-methyltransferase